MELNIASHGFKKDLTIDLQRERHDGKKSDKTLKKPIEESKTINTAPVKISARDKKKVVKEVGPTQENERCRFTLKELEKKKYHFLDSDVPNMLEDLLQKNVIELPECKHKKKWVVLIIQTIVITIESSVILWRNVSF